MLARIDEDCFVRFDFFAFAAEAIDAIRDRARALGIVPERGLTLSLTGPAALDQEELESVSSGTLLASVLTTAAVTVLLV